MLINVSSDIIKIMITLSVFSVTHFAHLASLNQNAHVASILRRKMNVMIVQKMEKLL
jgi:hypothetical protein